MSLNTNTSLVHNFDFTHYLSSFQEWLWLISCDLPTVSESAFMEVIFCIYHFLMLDKDMLVKFGSSNYIKMYQQQ